jgi:hypothetical protein
MNCKKNGCNSLAVEGGDYCGEHWLEAGGHDPNAIHTSANTDHAPQRPIAPQAIAPQNPETKIATNTQDE